MKVDTDPDVLLSETKQLHNKFSDLDKVVSTERLTTIIFDVLLAENYSTIRLKSIKDPGLIIEQIEWMLKDDIYQLFGKVFSYEIIKSPKIF